MVIPRAVANVLSVSPGCTVLAIHPVGVTHEFAATVAAPPIPAVGKTSGCAVADPAGSVTAPSAPSDRGVITGVWALGPVVPGGGNRPGFSGVGVGVCAGSHAAVNSNNRSPPTIHVFLCVKPIIY